MRAKLTVMAAVIAMMVVGAVASEGGQPQKQRSVLRYSKNSGARSVVRSVTFNDQSYAQEPPTHQPPQVTAYTPAAARRVIHLQQQDSWGVSSQASQDVFLPPQTRPVNHGQMVTSEAAEGGDCHAAAGSPCCGGSPCCESSCCAPACCAPTCRGPVCRAILPTLFGRLCGCGHHGCCDDCCDRCNDCCGHHRHFGRGFARGGCGHDCCDRCDRCCGHRHGCGCGHASCCHDCCACPCAHAVDVFGWWNSLFGPCCRSRGGCHAACDCGCGGDCGCTNCGGCAGCGTAVMPGPVNKVPTPNNGSPSDVPPPPKVVP